MTVSTVSDGLEKDYHAIEQKRNEYDYLKDEVKDMIAAGTGKPAELEQHAEKLDVLQEEFTKGKARLDSQYIVVELTAENNLQNAYSAFFDESSKYFHQMDRVVGAVKERFSKFKVLATAKMESTQQAKAEKQAAVDISTAAKKSQSPATSPSKAASAEKKEEQKPAPQQAPPSATPQTTTTATSSNTEAAGSSASAAAGTGDSKPSTEKKVEADAPKEETLSAKPEVEEDNGPNNKTG